MLTITSQREKVIDFTKPVMSLGIGILYKRTLTVNEYFIFLYPLYLETWLFLMLSYFGELFVYKL